MDSSDFLELIKFLKDGGYPAGLSENKKRLMRKRAVDFHLVDGNLCYTRNWKNLSNEERENTKSRKVLILETDKKDAMLESHIDNDLHNTFKVTHKKLSDNYYWRGMFYDIKKYCKACIICGHQYKTTAEDTADAVKQEEEQFEFEEGYEHCWQKVELEVIGPFPKTSSGHCYVVVLVDQYSQWSEVFNLTELNPGTVSQGLLKFMSRFGVIEGLVTNQSEKFTLELEQKVLQLTGEDCAVKMLPKSNIPKDSIKQSLFATLKNVISCNPSDWDQYIEAVLLPYRVSRPQFAEYTPFYLVYGREPRLPSDFSHEESATTSDVSLTEEQIQTAVNRILETQKILKAADPPTLVKSKLCVQEIEKEQTEQRKVKDEPETSQETSKKKSANPVRIKESYKALLQYLKEETFSSRINSAEKRKIQKMAESFVLEDEELYFVASKPGNKKQNGEKSEKTSYRKVIIDQSSRKDLIREAHLGSDRSTENGLHRDKIEVVNILMKSCYWKGMAKDVEYFISVECDCPKKSQEPATKRMRLRREAAIIEQTKDPDWDILQKYLISLTYPSKYTRAEKRALTHLAESYMYNSKEDELVYLEVNSEGEQVFRKVIKDKKKRDELLEQYHKGGPEGPHCTKEEMSKLFELYYWPSMHRDINQYIQKCKDCAGSMSTIAKTWKPTYEVSEDDVDDDNVQLDNDTQNGGTTEAASEHEQVKQESVADNSEEKKTIKLRKTKKRSKDKFKCSVCGEIIIGESSYKVHQYQHTGVKPFGCELCDKRFTEAKYVKIHMRIHTGERPYVCSVCGKGFSRLGMMKQHAEVHNEFRRHLCTICGKSYSTKQQLRNHMYAHNGNAPFKCDKCNKGFSRPSQLKYHSQNVCYRVDCTCDVCGRTFKNPSRLKDHKNTHSGKTPYKCQYCDEKFAERHIQRTHEKLHLNTPEKSEEVQVQIQNEDAQDVTLILDNSDTPGQTVYVVDTDTEGNKVYQVVGGSDNVQYEVVADGSENVQYQIVYEDSEVQNVSQADFSAINLLASVTDQVDS